MAQRADLGAFLRSRRARVAPEAVGLPGGARRRVPGLRREELAQLAGISVEYYQRLEQGRAARPSAEVLGAIAGALGLSGVEREHLAALAAPRRPAGGGRDGAAGAAGAAAGAHPPLRHLLDLMERVPAFAMTDRFDVLAANALAVRVFAPVGPALAEPGAANLARHLFLEPSARDLYVEWDEVAAATAGQLRMARGAYPDDRPLGDLIAELAERSGPFRTLWSARDVALRASGAKSLRHPALGVLRLRYETFTRSGAPRQRLVTLTPEPDSATEAALDLLRTWTAPVPP